MNVDDILSDVIPTDFHEKDRLDLIFLRQHALAKKYVEIEVSNALCYTTDMPVDINDRFGQARLKDFFWRITEELTEAVDAKRTHGHIPSHTIEELADALHFMTEMYLLAGMSSEEWFTGSEDKLEYLVSMSVPVGVLEDCCYEVIHHIGCASNCLKQRPWKVSHQLVDEPKFRDHLVKALPALIDCFVCLGLDANAIFTIYWKKAEVNNFRIRSNY